MSLLPTSPAHALSERPMSKKWLVDQLWTNEGVGIIGGEPKCCKSFMALSMAIAVSSGTPCLGEYDVPNNGRVVLFAAEDAPHIVKGRLDGLCQSYGLNLESLDILVITVPVLRLDRSDDQKKLKNTIEKLRPKLLIIDPFVRIHRIDENASGEVAPILASLRELQRLYKTAIAVVHHAKKSAASARAGQALRGSSEFHAWGDVNLYLRRNRQDDLSLSIEHRDAKSLSGIPLRLIEGNGSIKLGVTDKHQGPKQLSIVQKIEEIFKEIDSPLPLAEIRSRIGVRAERVSQAVKEMIESGRLEKVPGGYRPPNSQQFTRSVPVHS